MPYSVSSTVSHWPASQFVLGPSKFPPTMSSVSYV
uniref:Uncharacterized protein n=1 Tax=Anguilla anguilla TaxID=7936 RepID=A0A0E9SZ31_ANGAN